MLHSGLAPYGDRLLTVAELEALAGTEPERGPNSQDFGYLVDPDGVLLEFNGNAETEDLFYGHLHFWHEAPLCAVNWYVEHLGARGTVHWLQAWWRPLHMGVAWLFLAGLLAHVIVVLFFAGYAAEGREIYWWHLTAWGG